jgi:hypothetical protein
MGEPDAPTEDGVKRRSFLALLLAPVAAPKLLQRPKVVEWVITAIDYETRTVTLNKAITFGSK